MHLRFILLVSLLLGITARGADSVLVFNEIHYHPANEAAETEWVELRSLQGVDVDISGWRIEGGIQYTFPAGTVMPGGGHVVIAAVPGQITGALGPFTGKLNNAGDLLRLIHRSGRLMDELEYEDGGEWPVGADGSGVTLARKQATAKEGPEEWTTSAAVGGTPGGENFTTEGTETTVPVQSLTGEWKYENGGAAVPGWNTPGFDDSAWASGSAPFYFGNPQPAADPATAVTSVGVWSMERWTGDADSQISSSKTYTHKVDLGHSGTPTVVNGVAFENHQTASGNGVIRSGTNWSLTGASQNLLTNTGAPANTMPVGSGSKQLLHEFYYGETNSTTEVLQLTGLTPNQFYIVTLYNAGWDERDFRRMRVIPSNTGVPTILDQGAAGGGKGTLVKYHFAAPASGTLSITFEPLESASWHQYAFTNEVASPILPERALAGTVQSFSSEASGRSADFSANGAGLTASGTHATVANGSMWQTNGSAGSPADPLPAEITWLLDQPATLTGLHVWNFNELLDPQGTVVDNTVRGVRNVTVLVSSDAAGETFASAGDYVVPQAFGSTSQIGSRIAFQQPQRNVRRVRLVANTNWGDASDRAGLSEVRFLTAGTLLPANPVTTLFRSAFNVPALPGSTFTLDLQYGADDGAIFYLNGSEIHRANITGAASNTTPADGDVARPTLSAVLNLPATSFVPGENVLAVELHQAASGGNDAWFAASLAVQEKRAAQGAATLEFSEVAAATSESFFIEFRNSSSIPVSTAGWSLRTGAGATVALPETTLAPGAFLVLDSAQL
ncbi:MAG: lamin tail domain-containing protein, partial [Chthoniobacteraceae bacterium]